MTTKMTQYIRPLKCALCEADLGAEVTPPEGLSYLLLGAVQVNMVIVAACAHCGHLFGWSRCGEKYGDLRFWAGLTDPANYRPPPR